MNNILAIPIQEANLRTSVIQSAMKASNVNSLLVSSNANIYYLTGRVFSGYIMITQSDVRYFVKRPAMLQGKNVCHIRKPEDIPSLLTSQVTGNFGFEMDESSYNTCIRLMKIFPDTVPCNADSILRAARAVKTDYQIGQISLSGKKQTEVYCKIPELYKPGMTDVDFQIAIETLSRKNGCLGQFRISGNSMELFMANILAGDNADNPTPYDFAMGGEGQDPSLPVGANGTVIKPGMSIMVDCNGNYTGYMTDMTRVFAVGEIDGLAIKAHNCSRRICNELAELGTAGTQAKDLYNRAVEIAKEEDLEIYFMGHNQKAGFVGHGVGIEINEAPVIAPKSKDILAAGNVIALEPKFVIPGTGAVGIENTYTVCRDGKMKCLTLAPEEIRIL